MHDVICHNGTVMPVAEARLSPGQAGLFNGWGIFTTVLVRHGRPFSFDRHWQRLSRDAALLRLSLPFASADVRSLLLEVVAANETTDCCARIYFVNNRGGFWHGEEQQLPEVDLMIGTLELPVYSGPAALGVRQHGRHAAHPLAGAKVISWLHNVWALDEIRRAGFDEVILLNERGEVSECTAANVFGLWGDRVATPPLSSGCLAGVTRDVLLELGRDLDRPIEERAFSLDDLRAADEVFITSTTRGVLPVVRVDEHQVPNIDGPTVRHLAMAFKDYVDRHCAP